MKKILLALAAIVIVGAGIGYYQYNKPVESLENKKPEIEVTAEKLLSDFQADEAAANALYNDKVVQVSGNVDSITTDAEIVKVHLNTGNPMSTVICEIENRKNIDDIKTGDDVKIKGKCTGYLSDVILVQSNVVR